MVYEVFDFELRFLLFPSLPTKDPSLDHDSSLALSLVSELDSMMSFSGIDPRSELLCGRKVGLERARCRAGVAGE